MGEFTHVCMLSVSLELCYSVSYCRSRESHASDMYRVIDDKYTFSAPFPAANIQLD